MHTTLSRIDLCLGTTSALPLVSAIWYAPKGVSDHPSPVMWLLAQPCSSLPRAPWRLNAFWLKLFLPANTIAQNIERFFLDHVRYADGLVRWDAFKCYLSSIFICTINAIKLGTKEHEMQLALHVKQLEQEYITNSSKYPGYLHRMF